MLKRFSPDVWQHCAFDPATLTAVSLASTAAGTIAGGAGALIGGSAAQQAGQYKAAQLRSNESGAIAGGQRNMFDTQMKTRLAEGSTVARAAASGVNAGVGSPATDVGNIANRGSYLAASDLFRGENEATGLENEARGAIYTGDTQKEAGDLNAFGTIAGGMGSMAQAYGRYAYPDRFGKA